MSKNPSKTRNPYVVPMIIGRKGGKIPSKKQKEKDNFDWFDEFNNYDDNVYDGYFVKGKK